VNSLFRIRPRYRLRSPLSADEVRARVVAGVKGEGSRCRGSVDERKVELMARGEHHVWSPELRAYVVDEPDGGSTMVGRFGPSPAVWTMFAAIYLHLAFITVAGLVYATAQLTLGDPPTAALAAPAALVLALLVRLVAHVGQNLGANEMTVIRTFVAETVPGRPLSQG
jgi:hypothetical protein